MSRRLIQPHMPMFVIHLADYHFRQLGDYSTMKIYITGNKLVALFQKD